MSIEILSNSQVATKKDDQDSKKSTTKSNYDYLKSQKVEEVPVDTFANFKISNQMIEKMLSEDGEGDKNKPIKKKALTCTKCKNSQFFEQDELRKHFKTEWHNFNAKLSAQSKESLSADEYDEYILMHPEALK